MAGGIGMGSASGVEGHSPAQVVQSPPVVARWRTKASLIKSIMDEVSEVEMQLKRISPPAQLQSLHQQALGDCVAETKFLAALEEFYSTRITAKTKEVEQMQRLEAVAAGLSLPGNGGK